MDWLGDRACGASENLFAQVDGCIRECDKCRGRSGCERHLYLAEDLLQWEWCWCVDNDIFTVVDVGFFDDVFVVTLSGDGDEGEEDISLFEVADDTLIEICSRHSDIGDTVFVCDDGGWCDDSTILVGDFIGDGVESWLTKTIRKRWYIGKTGYLIAIIDNTEKTTLRPQCRCSEYSSWSF